MKKRFVIVVLAIVAMSPFAIGGEPALSALASVEACRYESVYSNILKSKIEEGHSILNDIVQQYPDFYKQKITVEGEGENRLITITREETLVNKTTVMAEYKLRAGSTLEMISSRRVTKSPDGAIMREREYDYTEPSIGLPKNTFHFLVIDFFLRYQHLEIGSEHRMYAYVESTLLLPMLLKVEGEKKLSVKSGEYDCWVVSLYLDKKRIEDLTGRVVSLFFPKTVFWIEKDAPHRLVRLKWPVPPSVAGRKDASQLIELAEISQ